MFYSGSIFENAGVPKSSIQYAILGVGALNFVMTIIAVSQIWLIFIVTNINIFSSLNTFICLLAIILFSDCY